MGTIFCSVGVKKGIEWDYIVAPSMMLDVQYRMHPMIVIFPSKEFYNRSLRNGTVDSNGVTSPGLQPPVSQHLPKDARTGNRPSVVFLDHTGRESTSSRSWVNKTEGYIVRSIVEDLLLNNEGDLRGYDIGIITPYAAQVTYLTRLLKGEKQQARFRKVLGDKLTMELWNIEIKTVDGFEGREKEVIIFSTVRNNEGGYIGFLADRRRLNVALTRARRGLFVVGSLDTLKNGKVGDKLKSRVGKGAESWHRYAEYVSDGGLVERVVA